MGRAVLGTYAILDLGPESVLSGVLRRRVTQAFLCVPCTGPPQQYPGQEDYYGEQYNHAGQGAAEGGVRVPEGFRLSRFLWGWGQTVGNLSSINTCLPFDKTLLDP